MSPTQSHSVTDLLLQLRSGDSQACQDAAARIWARYMGDLLALARRQLAPRVRRREDEHDVLQSMYKSFCARQQRGGYDLADRKDLWRLLVAMTENKARTVAGRHGRRKRDFRREAEPGPATSDESGASLLDQAAGVGPTPAEAAVLVEELERRLKVLDEPLRRLALWKLEGYRNEEIAAEQMMDCGVRTVERKLSLIRQLWEGPPAKPMKA
jgi:hypothetical protein